MQCVHSTASGHQTSGDTDTPRESDAGFFDLVNFVNTQTISRSLSLFCANLSRLYIYLCLCILRCTMYVVRCTSYDVLCTCTMYLVKTRTMIYTTYKVRGTLYKVPCSATALLYDVELTFCAVVYLYTVCRLELLHVHTYYYTRVPCTSTMYIVGLLSNPEIRRLLAGSARLTFSVQQYTCVLNISRTNSYHDRF